MHEIVQAHQERGHTVVLSSSALSIQALPVARFLGITNVQCNHFELDEQRRLTGGIVKPVVWGATKAAAVQQFCTDNDVALQPATSMPTVMRMLRRCQSSAVRDR